MEPNSRRIIFGNKVHELRNELKLSQEQLAEKLVVSRSTIAKWENGKIEPSLDVLFKVAEQLNTSINYLLGDTMTESKKYIVLDTSVLMERPLILEDLSNKFDKIIVPKTLREELNHLKDGKNVKYNVQRKAHLAFNNLNKYVEKGLVEQNNTDYGGDSNDQKIVNCAIDYAKKEYKNKVYMFSNDIDFKFLIRASGVGNLECINSREYYENYNFNKNTNFDSDKSQKIFNVIKNISNKDNKDPLDLIKEICIDNESGELKFDDIDFNMIDDSSGLTPLIQAIDKQRFSLVEFLLNIDSINKELPDKQKYKFTPLLHACQKKNFKILKLLVEYGCNVNCIGKAKNIGNTPLMVCAWHGFTDGVKLLLQCNVSVNQQDNNGFTALHKACIHSHYEIAKLLIDKTDIDIFDYKEKRADEYLNANNPEDQKIIKLFEEKRKAN